MHYNIYETDAYEKNKTFFLLTLDGIFFFFLLLMYKYIKLNENI